MSGQAPKRGSKKSFATDDSIRRAPSRKRKTPSKRKTSYKKRTNYSAAYNKQEYMTGAGIIKRAPPSLALKVSDCAMRYMATMVNPFNAEPGACVPCDLFPLPSQKIRSFTRGSFQLGTTGFGFISCTPVAANDADCAQFTTSTSVGGSGTAFSSFTLPGTTRMTTLPYNGAQLTGVGTVQARVVSIGIRVRYAGPETSRGGTVACYEDQDHTPTLSTLTYLSMLQAPSCKIYRPSGDGDWDGTVCSSGPVQPQELEFISLAYPNASSTNQNVASSYLHVAISGSPADRYDFEIFQHVEYIGTVVIAKTPSHADTDQYGKIVQSAKEISNVQPLSPKMAPSLWERFQQKVSESLPQIVNLGVGGLRALAGDPSGYAQILGGAASMISNGSNGPSLRRGQTQLMREIEN